MLVEKDGNSVKGRAALVAFSLLAVFDAEGCLNVSWTARVVVKVEPVNNVSFLVLFSFFCREKRNPEIRNHDRLAA